MGQGKLLDNRIFEIHPPYLMRLNYIPEHWGSIEKFNQLIQKIKDDESNVAKLAIKQFGSIEKHTEAMKYNLEHFSDLMEQSKVLAKNKDEILQKNNDL
ncbi:hypothetical protein [Lacrimispora sp.]|uniref:hypothetical protein n=1 Tax=Lacrimispora sp. TaxID=2719234 RepID=UPI0028AA572B|nr:hypothetical protein [Lacrimispora sp.]